MTIKIDGGRDVMDQWVLVEVEAGDTETISTVQTLLDGVIIGNDPAGGLQSYSRRWSQVGTGSPNERHKVYVSVLSDSCRQVSAVKEWRD